MIIEALLEQSIIDALQSELGNDVQLVGSRRETKVEDADKKTIVAVASGFRNHDAFSLSLINVPVAISVATRVEGDAQSQEHNEVVEKIVDILVDWHKYGEAMSDALTNEKFLAGELRMDGGTTQTFDREMMIWTDTININIRGSEKLKDKALTYVKYDEDSGLEPWSGLIVGQLTNDSIPEIWNSTDIEIGKAVTSIAGSALMNCDYLSSISIPRSVTSIGEYAFEACQRLTEISLPDTLTSLGESAFNGCTNLRSVHLSNAMTSIPRSLFYGCSNLPSLVIPDGVTSIGPNAFYDCISLTALTISANVTSIGEYALQGCNNLTDVTFKGKTTAQVQVMENYPWGANGNIIHGEL